MPKISVGDKARENLQEQVSVSSGYRFKEAELNFFRKEFEIDIVEEYKKLKHIGELPADKILDRMALTREINSAAGNARRANLIFLKAKRERELFRIEFSRTVRKLHRQAMQNVDAWMKDREIKKKQITKEMLDQEINSDPELSKEYLVWVEKQEELRMIRDDCEVLAREWSSRKNTLQTQARLISNEKELIFGRNPNAGK